MAENLFSKYRPIIFPEVFGHEKTIKELKQRAKENNFAHVMLLSGYTGTGKTTIEKIISKSILCQNKDNEGNPCNVCESCLTVHNEKPSNYYYLFNASNLGIDDMREIETLSTMRTLSLSKYRVIVIDELQELSGNQKAAKNVLKVLEKPNEFTFFILLTMEESKINSAIKNRCVPYKLRPLEFSEISKYLFYICQKEGIEITTKERMETLTTIANNSNGSMRTAVSYLERCIYSDIWNKEEILKELSILSNEEMNGIINMLLSGNYKALEFIDPTKEFVDKLRYILGLILKHKVGVTLNPYQKSLLQGIAKHEIEVVNNSLKTVMSLIQFPYLNAEIIETTLINLILELNANKPKEKIQAISTEDSDRRRVAK